MKIRFTHILPVILLLMIAFIFSCKPKGQEKKLDATAELNVIQSKMDEQERSWNNANLEGFMAHYWKNDSLRFIGKRGITYGWQSTLDNYKKGYPDAAAMGKLKFTNLHKEVMDSCNAFVIGKWELFRTQDTLSGHYTLFWKKLKGNWVIVADHSS